MFKERVEITSCVFGFNAFYRRFLMHRQSIVEIMQKAVDVEMEGADFYRKLAGEVSIEAVKNVFLMFVADEVRHQADFTALARTMKGVVIESSLDILGVMTLAVTTLRQIMKGSELVDMSDVNLGQAIRIAIHNEQEAIRVYSSLLEVANVEFNVVMTKIIAEERAHLAALEAMKKSRLG
jgi:rubrerythrin